MNSKVTRGDQLIQGTGLTVQLNGAAAKVAKRGLYDFDGARGAIQVVDGKLEVTSGLGHTDVDKGKQLQLATLKKHGFGAKSLETEPLYVWSQARSQDEAQMSYNAAQRASLYATAGPGWFWDPYYSYYGFWAASAYLASPFGWGFYSPLYFGFYGGLGGWYGGYPYRYGYAGIYRHPVVSHAFVGGVSARVGGFQGGGFHGGGGDR